MFEPKFGNRLPNAVEFGRLEHNEALDLLLHNTPLTADFDPIRKSYARRQCG
jgi:hypothetical protein